MKNQLLESQIHEILEVVQRLAAEDYTMQAKTHGKSDLIDSLALGIKMLGEEIKASNQAKTENREQLVRKIKQIEDSRKQVAEEKEKYKSLTENVNIGIYRSSPDAEGKFIEANPSMLEIFGYPDKETFLQLSPGDLNQDPEIILKIQKELARKSHVKNKEMVLRKMDGTPVICSVSIVPVYNNQGKVEFFDGVIEDITKRSRLQAELREQVELLDKITSSAQDAIVVIDQNGAVIFWNRAAESIFGLSSEEMIGKDFHALLTPKKYHADQLKGFIHFRETGTGPAIGNAIELTALRKSGEEFFVELSLSGIKINNQWHGIGIIRDITNRKEISMKLVDLNNELKEVLKSKDKFLSIIAHDLKAPFNTLIGFSDLLLKTFDEREPEEIKSLIKHINNSSMQGFNLLNNLPEWSRSQTGRIKYEPELFSFAQLVDEVIDIHSGIAAMKKIKLDGNSIAVGEVIADKKMIHTALRNLVSNAIKFTGTGGEVRIKGKDLGNEFEISVSDSGVGIPEENLSKLFSISENYSTRGTDNEMGTGLGLLLCKEFVEKNGGKIRVISELGQGSEFFFTIPKK